MDYIKMKRYALLIIENDEPELLERDCKPLNAILEDANTTLNNSEFQGIGALVFDLSTSLIPFCKVTASADKLGHKVRVLFLDDINSFFSPYKSNSDKNNNVEELENFVFDFVETNNK